MHPLVTVGFVNCNRLHYLQSCLESLVHCTADYPEKELIVVDNASVEPGTTEYLDHLTGRGVRVFRTQSRDPNNEFAKGLNTIVRESRGEYVMLLQSDMQFVVRGKWMERYINFLSRYVPFIGCIALDAQRKVTVESHSYAPTSDPLFLIDRNRPSFAGAGDAVFSREILSQVGPWSEKNLEHEGTHDSETDILHRVKMLHPDLVSIVPTVPPSVMIYTDPRGTNARVRGNRRYGQYWPPKQEWKYYGVWDFDRLAEPPPSRPLSIEVMADPIGWRAPVDVQGNWLKNPIRPETAKPGEYVELGE